MNKILDGLLALLKCLIGKHNVPRMLAFPQESMFIAGGICPRCGTLKRGKVIGDIRDYNSLQARREGSFLILANGYYVFTSVATMINLYDFYREEYSKYLVKVELNASPSR